jgi:phage terminase large subunit-like protein
MNSAPSVLDSPLSLADVDAIIGLQQRTKVKRYYPEAGPLRRELYPKHQAYFTAGGEHQPTPHCPPGCSGAPHRERLFIAGNRVGKSEGVGAFEVTYHLTGLYPAWWKGHRFQGPVSAWVAGETNITVRDILQAKLLGKIVRQSGDRPDQAVGLGTGMIPADTIRTTRPKSGIPNAIETAWIRHASGGSSTLTFKTYEQGQGVFMGTEQHIVWFDEEPPEDVYTEGLMRTMRTSGFAGGLLLLTFTPLRGWTTVVERFMNEKECVAASRFVVQAGWDDAPHLSESEKAEMAAKLPPHQRDARTKGIPALGTGAIYPVEESALLVDPFGIPKSWPRGYGLDVGWNWTSAVWSAHDRDNDILYLDSEYFRSEGEPSIHAAAIRGRGDWMPGVVDPAANGRSQIDGRQLLEMYKGLGLDLTQADNSVETGIYEVWTRMCSGRLKIFRSLAEWQREFRQYHRDAKGRIVKSSDHLMDASRYRVMHLDRLRTPPVKKDPERRSREAGSYPGAWMG